MIASGTFDLGAPGALYWLSNRAAGLVSDRRRVEESEGGRGGYHLDGPAAFDGLADQGGDG